MSRVGGGLKESARGAMYSVTSRKTVLDLRKMEARLARAGDYKEAAHVKQQAALLEAELDASAAQMQKERQLVEDANQAIRDAADRAALHKRLSGELWEMVLSGQLPNLDLAHHAMVWP